MLLQLSGDCKSAPLRKIECGYEYSFNTLSYRRNMYQQYYLLSMQRELFTFSASIITFP